MKSLSSNKMICILAILLICLQIGVFAGSKKETGGKNLTFLSIWPEDKDNSKLIMDLSKEFQKANPGFNIEFELVAAENLRQKVKVLVSSKSVPDLFIYESGKPIVELIDAGVLLNIEKTFSELGIMDSLDPGAVSLLKRLADNRGLFDLPLGMNVEGIWYNKKMFAKLGLKPPKTKTELVNVCNTLIANGIQPFTAGGKDKWPLTRIINMYVMRKMGVDAMEKAAKGEISFTEPGFIEAAAAVQNMVRAGYFGKGIVTVDYSAAADMLFSGKAAMLYNGSWFTQDLNDPARNLLGPDGIGFFNIPLVEGGVGTMDDYSVNCGNILVLSAASYDEKTGEWLKYVIPRLGDYAMETFGKMQGYRVTNMPADLPPYTKIVAEELKKVKNAGLWFEASMDDKTTQVAQDYGQSLFLLEITPEDYFMQIEKSSAEFRNK
jgi:raffinose/stachyose/melibiose transport system substrate-binding protein